jgi:hypothetical protein
MRVLIVYMGLRMIVWSTRVLATRMQQRLE